MIKDAKIKTDDYYVNDGLIFITPAVYDLFMYAMPSISPMLCRKAALMVDNSNE